MNKMMKKKKEKNEKNNEEEKRKKMNKMIQPFSAVVKNFHFFKFFDLRS